MQVVSSVREPLVTGQKTMANVTDDISRQVLGKPTISWMLTVGFVLGLLTLGMVSLYFTLFEGIGMWGLNKTVGWAWDITNFVWWIGIGHAGTLISAILLLFRQKWRNSINRSAEAMTIFAVMCAGLFPIIHMGRPWVGFYWVFPLPNTFGSLWVNFHSPLLWDVFAISTYFIVSLVFWYLGLIPDLATIREKVQNKVSKFIYGVLSFGWIGSVKDWQRYEQVSLILAGIATPLVLSVHSVVSMDFATTLVPG
ncbi:MAG: hydrogenase, partial [Bacteroidetes bacterium]|nr:hydrogenase [Bacteroidota bacterium]